MRGLMLALAWFVVVAGCERLMTDDDDESQPPILTEQQERALAERRLRFHEEQAQQREAALREEAMRAACEGGCVPERRKAILDAAPVSERQKLNELADRLDAAGKAAPPPGR